jgi:hypothetical protein
MMSGIWLLFLVLGQISCAPNSVHPQSDPESSALERLNTAVNNLEKVVPDSNELVKSLFPGHLRTILGGPRRFSVAQEGGKIRVRPVRPVATAEVIETYAEYLNWMANSGEAGYAYFREAVTERAEDLQSNAHIHDPHKLDKLGVNRIQVLRSEPLVQHESGHEVHDYSNGPHGGTATRSGHQDGPAELEDAARWLDSHGAEFHL